MIRYDAAGLFVTMTYYLGVRRSAAMVFPVFGCAQERSWALGLCRRVEGARARGGGTFPTLVLRGGAQIYLFVVYSSVFALGRGHSNSCLMYSTITSFM